MPTGYTMDIYDGKDVSFKQFAIECARAFGACVDLRDEPRGIEIPELKPSPHYKDKVESLKVDLKNFKLKSDSEILDESDNKVSKWKWS